MDLSGRNLPAGTRLSMGSAVIEITSQPHTGCAKVRLALRRRGDEIRQLCDRPRAQPARRECARHAGLGSFASGDVARKLLQSRRARDRRDSTCRHRRRVPRVSDRTGHDAGAPDGSRPRDSDVGFVYETPPTPQCHASTIVETPSGVVAAWFGTRNTSVTPKSASGPHVASPARGALSGRRRRRRSAGRTRHPTWNPALFKPRGGPLMLFYKGGAFAERLVGHGRDLAGRRAHVVGADATA